MGQQLPPPCGLSRQELDAKDFIDAQQCCTARYRLPNRDGAICGRFYSEHHRHPKMSYVLSTMLMFRFQLVSWFRYIFPWLFPIQQGFIILSELYCKLNRLIVFVPATTKIEVFVPDFPDTFFPDSEDKSLHVSTMFEIPTVDVETWFREYLVSPIEWDLTHPEDVPPDASSQFDAYHSTFQKLGYKIWKIDNSLHATSYLKITRKTDGRYFTIAGRPDRIITRKTATVADYMKNMLCVIEIQSRDDTSTCELQLQAYLLLIMNTYTKNLSALIGFLVRRDGQCRAMRAIRDPRGDCIFETNSLFHVYYLPSIMDQIVKELKL